MAKKIYKEKTETDKKAVESIVKALKKDSDTIVSCATFKDVNTLLKSAVDKLEVYKTLGEVPSLSSSELNLTDIRVAVGDFNKSICDVICRDVESTGILLTMNELSTLSKNQSDMALSIPCLKLSQNKSLLFKASVSFAPISQKDFLSIVCNAKGIKESEKVKLSEIIITNFEKFSKNIGSINSSNNTKPIDENNYSDESESINGETKATNDSKLVHELVISEVLKNSGFTSVTNICKTFNDYINSVVIKLAEIDGIELKKNFKNQKYGIVITRKLVDAVLKPDKMESTRNRVIYPNSKIISNCWGMALVGLHMALTSIYKNTANKNNAENQLELIQTNATATTSEILQAPQVSEIVLVKA